MSAVDEFTSVILPCVPPEEVRVVLDLGSRDARESLELSRKYPEAMIYAFECHPDLIPHCRANVREAPNVEIIPLAVHSFNGPVTFYPIDTRYQHNMGASSLFLASGAYDDIERYPQLEIEVEAVRLDTWARSRGIKRFDLVWMDLQGAELLALNGMGELLLTVKAIYTEVEYREIYRGQVLFEALDKFLVAAGFGLLDLRDEVAGWFGNASYVRRGLLENAGIVTRRRRAPEGDGS